MKFDNYISQSEIIRLKEYPNTNYVARLIESGKVPPPDLVIETPMRRRLWLREKLALFPDYDDSFADKPYRRIEKPTKISVKSSEILQTTQDLYRIMRNANTR